VFWPYGHVIVFGTAHMSPGFGCACGQVALHIHVLPAAPPKPQVQVEAA
jgi:hypothetical protein